MILKNGCEMRLKDKVAIVTGGNRGIGKAIAITLAKEGCNIFIAARDQKKMKEAEKEIKNSGVNVLTIKCDVRNSKDVKKVVEETMKKIGRIDILVNNAGVAYYKTLVETTEQEYDEIMDVNVKGIFLFTKNVLPIMIKQHNGVIVNISSGAGKSGFANLAAYCASKFAVNGFTEALAEEVGDYGIRVYAVCPGTVDTDMVRNIPAFRYIPKLKPEDVAKKVVDLCLPRCTTPSGSAVDVAKWL